MSMTKSDYEMLAAAFMDQRIVEMATANKDGMTAVSRLARRLALMLSDKSKQFNRVQFLHACGLSDEEMTQ